MKDDAEAPAQGRGDESGPRRRADESELWQGKLDRSGRRALPNHNVKLKVLHRRIENFLDGGGHAVNLVYEENGALLQACQQRGEVARILYNRPRGRARLRAHLVGYDVRERRLP